MRKNKTIRFAAILLVLTLLSTCVVSGTFAKYTTKGEATDTATVAKWGVKVTATTAGDAIKEYDGTTAEVAADVKLGTAGNQIIAPGTKVNDVVSIAITGTPEVKVEVSYAAEVTLKNWEVSGDYYCPLEVTVGTKTLKGTDYEDADKFIADIIAEVAAYKKTYDANTDLASKANEELVINVAWAFNGDDAKDTALGDAASAATIAIKVTATVTQVD